MKVDVIDVINAAISQVEQIGYKPLKTNFEILDDYKKSQLHFSKENEINFDKLIPIL